MPSALAAMAGDSSPADHWPTISWAGRQATEGGLGGLAVGCFNPLDGRAERFYDENCLESRADATSLPLARPSPPSVDRLYG